MKEMYRGVVNSPETTITNDISNTDTLIYVLDDSRVPDDLPNLMTIGTGTNAETVKVVSKAGSAITVIRGFQGVAKAWPTGSIIARNFTEYDYSALMENIDTLREDTDINEDGILDLMSYVGDLESLDTDEKANIVLALNEIYQDLKSHEEDLASQEVGKGASLIGIHDANALFTATNVEGALDELFTDVADLASQEINKGASLIGIHDANALFTATNVEGALDELFQSVSNGKSLIAGAITDKGVDTSPSDSFSVMADNIGDISSSGELPKGLLTSPLSKNIVDAPSGFAMTENFIIIKQSSNVYIYNFEGDLLETFAIMGNGRVLGIFDNKCFLTNTSNYIDLNTLQLASLDVTLRPGAVLSRYDDGLVYYIIGGSVYKADLSLNGEVIATCVIATSSTNLAQVIVENENSIFVYGNLNIYKVDKSTFSIVAESNIGMIPVHSSFFGGKIYLTNNAASNNSLVVDSVTLSIITSSNTARNCPIVSIGEQGDIFRFFSTDFNQLDNTTLQVITNYAKPGVSTYYIDENKILYFISNKLFSVRNLL